MLAQLVKIFFSLLYFIYFLYESVTEVSFAVELCLCGFKKIYNMGNINVLFSLFGL